MSCQRLVDGASELGPAVADWIDAESGGTGVCGALLAMVAIAEVMLCEEER